MGESKSARDAGCAKVKKPFQWFGGKGRNLKRILPYIPIGGNPYVEPYAGSLAVLLARQPAPAEVANDIDDRIINFFRTIQNQDTLNELMALLRQTMYSRAEYVRASQLLNSNSLSVLCAWAFMVVLNQGFAGHPQRCEPGNWGRNLTHLSNTKSWCNKLAYMHCVSQRLANVKFECRDGVDCILEHDNPDAVIYVDPPYVMESRKNKNERYRFEVYNHDRIIDVLMACKGAVVLSGYDHPLFNRLTDNGWHKIQFLSLIHI